MAKEKLGSLMSNLRSICEKKERYAKGLDEKSSALPEVQETNEYYGFGGYNYWGFDSDGRHWDEESEESEWLRKNGHPD